MYKVLGIDRKEYGPVSAEVVRRWVRERRVHGGTLACAQGTDQWKPLAQFSEFADLFQPETGSSAGPAAISQPGASQPAAAQGQRTVPPVLTSRSAPIRPPESRLSGLATGALVCGLFGFCTGGVTAVLGLVLGLVGLRKIARSQGRLTGRGLALAGVGFSVVAIVLWGAILVSEILPQQARQAAREQSAQCLGHLRQLGMALHRYANDQSDRFPNASNWCDALARYLDEPAAYQCPAGPKRWRCHYAYNARLSGKQDVQVSPKTVAFFEIDGGWNTSGGAERVPRSARHGAVHVCYVDGSVEAVPYEQVRGLRWEP